jgi:long-chain acyl-CoA synthetase
MWRAELLGDHEKQGFRPGVVAGDLYLSREEVLDMSARAASLFASLSLCPGDAVGLLMRNDADFLVASLAASRLGAYAVPYNWHLKRAELSYLVSDSSPRVLIAHEDLYAAHRDVLGRVPNVFLVATPPFIRSAYALGEVGRIEGVPYFRDELAKHPPIQGPPRSGPPAMIYTSGTTGLPKGVRRGEFSREQRELIKRLNAKYLGIREGMRTVIPAPLYHTAPNMYALSALRNRGLVVLMARFDPHEFLELVAQHQIDTVQLVPTMMKRLLGHLDLCRSTHDAGTLSHIVHAAAPCPVEVKKAFIERFGPIVFEYYGSTETGMVSACDSREWLSHPGTVGRPVEGVEVRIIRDDGTEAGPREPGEVFVRNAAYGDFTYHNDPDKRRSVEREGFVSVGDIGYLDEEGYLYLCDRRADIIVSGGVNVYSAEVEAALASVPGVRDCAVVGAPDEDLGEVPVAFVQPEEGASLTEEGVKAAVSEILASFKMPRKVFVVRDLPREDNGKVYKRLLRERLREGISDFRRALD